MDAILEQSLQKLPSDIRIFVQSGWEAYSRAVEEQYSKIPSHIDFIPSLRRVWAGSDFVMKNCIRSPDMVLDLFESGDIFLEYYKGDYAKRLKLLLNQVKTIDELKPVLREFRRREMTRIAWRDLARWARPVRTMNDLSALADTILNLSYELLFKWLCNKYGSPVDAKGRTLPLLIVAMGKLGAYELNFSSDVDLIYCFPEDGELDSGMSYQQFYTRLAQQFTHLHDDVTKDGFVFRVDVRLRPYGTSGHLVNSFKSLEDYYRVHGREWERYALTKARVLNTDSVFSPQLTQIINLFVYRDYLDYSAIESLRKLQLKISSEIKKQGLQNNIKRGPGGIREIEFLTQTHKIIRGGKQLRLQERNTLKTLILLREARCLSKGTSKKLANSYLFLRNVENKLQIFNDQQTHTLPDDPLIEKRIAYAMGYITVKNFRISLKRHKDIIHSYFEKLIALPKMEFSEESDRHLEKQIRKHWENIENSNEHNEIWNKVGFLDSVEIHGLLLTLKVFALKQKLSHVIRSHLRNLLPHMLIMIGRTEYPDKTLRRMLPLLETVLSHNRYLVLFIENPIALSQAVNLCAASPWVATQLGNYPVLLDELLDPKTLFTPPTTKLLRYYLQQQLVSIEEDDLQQKIDVIRRFKQAHVLRVAAADVTGVLPIMRVSDYLTDIATVVIDKLRELISQELVTQHGSPTLSRKHKQHGFCILAYGKLGGIELGYTSDLDLVFLHPKLDSQALTTGKTKITNEQFFLRLGQKLIQVLSQPHASGFLYKTDMRLRPSGKSGLLANSVSAFANYQHTDAWSWEHQALVRSRPLCGAKSIGRQFEKIRINILGQARSPDELRYNVNTMREKMRESKQQHEEGYFDLKQGKGGLVDIEFIAQYAVLRWGCHYPSLLEYTDNVRIFERVGMEGLMRVKDVRVLMGAYKTYRVFLHKASLQKQGDMIPDGEFQFFRIAVLRLWEQMFKLNSQSMKT